MENNQNVMETTLQKDQATQAPQVDAPVERKFPAPTGAKRKGFAERMGVAGYNVGRIYDVIKNKFISYQTSGKKPKQISSRIVSSGETFAIKSKKIAKLTLVGGYLRLFLGLDPTQYAVSKYHHKDKTGVNRYRHYPFMLKISSKRRLGYALELIEDLMKLNECQPIESYVAVDQAHVFPQERRRTPIFPDGTKAKGYAYRMGAAGYVAGREYDAIKNQLMQYKVDGKRGKPVKCRIAKGGETFSVGSKKIAKLTIVGGYLRLFLALDPTQYAQSKYHHKDKSAVNRYRHYPFMLRIKSKRSLGYALELIDELARLNELVVNESYLHVDLAGEFPYLRPRVIKDENGQVIEEDQLVAATEGEEGEDGEDNETAEENEIDEQEEEIVVEQPAPKDKDKVVRVVIVQQAPAVAPQPVVAPQPIVAEPQPAPQPVPQPIAPAPQPVPAPAPQPVVEPQPIVAEPQIEQPQTVVEQPQPAPAPAPQPVAESQPIVVVQPPQQPQTSLGVADDHLEEPLVEGRLTKEQLDLVKNTNVPVKGVVYDKYGNRLGYVRNSIWRDKRNEYNGVFQRSGDNVLWLKDTQICGIVDKNNNVFDVEGNYVATISEKRSLKPLVIALSALSAAAIAVAIYFGLIS